MRLLEIIRFFLVGLSSALTQFGVLAFLFGVCVLPLGFSVSIAYLASVVVHFVGNKYFTFRSFKVNANEVLRYMALVLLNYIITISVVWIFVEVLRSTPYSATVVSIALTVGVGYALSRTWVFKQ